MGAWRLVTVLVLASTGCGGCHGRDSSDPVVGRYGGGTVTATELAREATRLPPALRQQFESATGRREMVNAIIDRRLLADEARRRGYAADAEVARQVRELEERLTIQSLLTAEEKALGPPTEAEARAWYQAHLSDLSRPAQVRVSRVLAAVGRNAGEAERRLQRSRADRMLLRLRQGESMRTVALEGDGPERTRGGDLGLLVRGASPDRKLEDAAFALEKPGGLSAVVTCDEGFAVLQLAERHAGRVPPYEEVRGEVANRMQPQRQRKAFDDLLSRLRQSVKVTVELPEVLR